MLQPLFDGIAGLLSIFYDLSGSIGLSIVLMTIVVMLLTSPLTMKATRSQMRMQKYLPEIQRIQKQHKADREKLNAEMMAFYEREGLNPLAPVSGCLLTVVQMPVFIVLFQVLRGLGNMKGGKAEPKFLDHGSDLYQNIVGAGGKLMSWGINLADQATSSHGSFGKALPYWLLIALVGATAWFQQRQLMGRRTDAQQQANPQMQAVMKFMPFMMPVISLSIPAGVVIYFFVSNLFRIGQQELVHLLEGRRNGTAPVAKAARPRPEQGAVIEGTATPTPPKGAAKPAARPAPTPSAAAHSRSKKKRKRKR